MKLRLVFKDMINEKGQFQMDASDLVRAGDCASGITSYINGQNYVREFDGDADRLLTRLASQFSPGAGTWADKGTEASDGWRAIEINVPAMALHCR